MKQSSLRKIATIAVIAPTTLGLAACNTSVSANVTTDKHVSAAVDVNLHGMQTMLRLSGVKDCDSLLGFLKGRATLAQTQGLDGLAVSQINANPLTCRISATNVKQLQDATIFSNQKIVMDLSQLTGDNQLVKFVNLIPGIKYAGLASSLAKVPLSVTMPTKIISAPGARVSDNRATWANALDAVQNRTVIEAEPLPKPSAYTPLPQGGPTRWILITIGILTGIAAIGALGYYIYEINTGRRRGRKPALALGKHQPGNPQYTRGGRHLE